jgi:hypothetical protein
MANGGTLSAQALGAIEPPDAWASMGRGTTDLYEPIVQAWLNATSPQEAAKYRKQCAENERLYQRGLQAGYAQSPTSDPSQWGSPFAGRPNQYPWLQPKPQTDRTPPDRWRDAGRFLPIAPLVMVGGGLPAALTPEALMGGALTTSTYQTLDALRRKLGILE